MATIIDGTTGVSQVQSTADLLTPVKTALNASGSAPIYACRAWVNFNGTGTVAIRASGNVSSITDNGVGNYMVNFTTAMPDANYVGGGMASADNIRAPFINFNQNTQGVPTTTMQAINVIGDDGVSYDRTYIYLSFFR